MRGVLSDCRYALRLLARRALMSVRASRAEGASTEGVLAEMRARYSEIKVLPSNASYAGTLRACERSLKRLGADRLDVCLLHWRGGTPLAETLRAFEELQEAGKIRAFGVSDFDVDDIEEAVAIEEIDAALPAGRGRRLPMI